MALKGNTRAVLFQDTTRNGLEPSLDGNGSKHIRTDTTPTCTPLMEPDGLAKSGSLPTGIPGLHDMGQGKGQWAKTM